jgi:hypothetical protein
MNTRVVAFGAFAIWLAASGDADPTKPTAVSGDLDGDGALDRAELVQHQSSITLTVHVGSLAAQQLDFAVDSGSQAAICSLPAELTVSPLTCTPDGPGDPALPGCTEAPGKVGLDISDGSCDAIHLYWHQETKQLVWWRR